MPFIKGLWVEPVVRPKEKIKISPSQINMMPLMARHVGGTYRVLMSIILTNNKTGNPKPIQFRDINQVSYKNAIISKLNPRDRKYMKLTGYNTVRATFDFDWHSWMKDSLSSVSPNNRLSRFEQRFSFSKQLPSLISNNVMRSEFDKFLVNKFKGYMEKNRKNRVWFDKFLPRDISGKIRNKISTMFDYEYDWQNNQMVAKLKDIYIMGILFAVGNEMTKDRNKLVKIDFEKSVKRKSKKFNKTKWESFIKKRFI